LLPYSASYWSEKPEEGKEIANSLWNSGKIIQPRIGDNVPQEWGIILSPEGSVKLAEMGTRWIDI
jgi:hypothetical protein